MNTKVILALITLATASLSLLANSAMSATATLTAHNQRSSSGALSTLIWNGANVGQPGGTAVGAEASTATWDWNYDTNTLSSTGLFFTTSHIGSNPMGSAVIGDRVVGLTLNTDADTTAASDYQCREGNFLATVGAHGCGNYSLGSDFANNSTIAYNVGVIANCIQRSLSGDDTSTGNPRGLFSAAAAGGCDAVDGSFDLWTVISEPDPSTGGELIIANSVPLTSAGTNYLTFTVAAGPGGGPLTPVAGDAAITASSRITTFNAASHPGNSLGNTPSTVVSDDTASTGSTSDSGNVITYTAPADFIAGVTDTFTYTITDADLESDTGTVTVTFDDISPDLADGTITTAEDTASTPLALTITQGNGTAAQNTVEVTTDGTKGTCTENDTTVTYTPNSGQTGSDSCVLTITDADGSTGTGTFNVTITASGGGGGGGGGPPLREAL